MTTDANNHITLTWYDIDGAIHRDDDRPAIINIDVDGSVESKIYFKHGKSHRGGDMPAQMDYCKDGSIYRKIWSIDGCPKRVDGGPTTVYYNDDGEIVREWWCDLDNNPHCVDGPAEIDHVTHTESYWLAGTRYQQNVWSVKRQAYLVHKMTIEEIEQALGKKIEIVGYVKADI